MSKLPTMRLVIVLCGLLFASQVPALASDWVEDDRDRYIQSLPDDAVCAPAPVQQSVVSSDTATAKKPNWFFNPQPMPMVNQLGRGIRNVGRAFSAATYGQMPVSYPVPYTYASPSYASPAVYSAPYTTSGGNDQYISGYTRRDGTYVNGYHRTSADGTTLNNYSHRGNYNPWTGKRGTRSH